MPVVPNDFAQSVMPQGELSPQQIQASPADFGAQVGQTLQQSGSQLEQQAILRQQNENETAANDVYASNFLPAFQKLYGDFYALQGKNAVDQRDPCLQAMEALRAGTRDSLSNPMQQRLFDSMARRTISMEQGAVIRYADQQNKVWQAQASDAAVAGFTNITADKYNDSQRLKSGLISIANEIAQTGHWQDKAPRLSASAPTRRGTGCTRLSSKDRRSIRRWDRRPLTPPSRTE